MASVYVRLDEIRLPTYISTREVSDQINVDYDHNGQPVGVEILGAVGLTVNGVKQELSDED